MKILVVHRQKETVDLIKSILSGCNPVVRHAESGLDGLLTSRIEHFDLIICGTDLPVVTGFEMVRSLTTHSVNRTTPFVFITDNVDAKSEHLSVALGALGIIALQDVPLKLNGMIQKTLNQTLETARA